MKRSGFTLVELSIVLIIIGLIIGGVLVGRDLIRAAEVRSIVAEVELFKTTFNSFRTKYNCLPGDCPNASDFWGLAASCPTIPQNPETNGVCNGNGDGSYTPWNADSSYVPYHLYMANMGFSIKGSNNYISLRLKGAYNAHTQLGNAYVYTNDLYSTITGISGNTLTFYAQQMNCANGVIIPAEQGKQIDTKMDDGIASKGSTFGVDGQEPLSTAGPCTQPVVACRSGTDYDTTKTTSDNPRCRMVFYLRN